MDIQTLTEFFKWCTIINAGLMILAGVIFLLVPDFVYRVHTRWFNISRDNFDAICYSVFAFYKIVFIVFNVVPWIVLELIG
ncbi:MAG: hypothetical protein PVF46_05910 [Lysobacterales bacterium]|jgi:hypothetical protein